MPTLTLEGLVLGLLAGLLLPPALVAALRHRLGRGAVLLLAAVALTAAAAFVIGFVQDHPDAAVGSLFLAPATAALTAAFLWADRPPVMIGLSLAAVAWLVPATRLVGLW